jgi:hypothetical protein
MKRGFTGVRRYLAARSKRFWVGAGAVAVALVAAAIAVPPSAFADDAPQLASASTTTSGDASSVTARCRSGRTAVAVTAELGGAAPATIVELTPRGGRGVASAVRTSGRQSWSLKATVLCVRHTTDIQYLSASKQIDTHTGANDVRVLCPGHKELIGFGWRVDPVARADAVTPLFASGTGGPGGTGTGSGGGTGTGGFPGTGSGGGTGTGGGPATNAFGVELSSTILTGRNVVANESVVAVCATGGHGTVGAVDATLAFPGGYSTLAVCPPDTHANALGFTLPQTRPRGQLLQTLRIEGRINGLMRAVQLQPPGPGDVSSVVVLCVAS